MVQVKLAEKEVAAVKFFVIFWEKQEKYDSEFTMDSSLALSWKISTELSARTYTFKTEIWNPAIAADDDEISKDRDRRAEETKISRKSLEEKVILFLRCYNRIQVIHPWK